MVHGQALGSDTGELYAWIEPPSKKAIGAGSIGPKPLII
jgi:hypothetical protein